MPDITPFLWFDHRAEEAAEFYVSLVPNSKIVQRVHGTDVSPPNGSDLLTAAFELDGGPFARRY